MNLIIGPMISTFMLFDRCIIAPLSAITVPFAESASLMTDASIAIVCFCSVGVIFMGLMFFGSISSCVLSSSFSLRFGFFIVSLILVFLSCWIVSVHSSE